MIKRLEFGNSVDCSEEVYAKCNIMLSGGNNAISISDDVQIATLNISVLGNYNRVSIGSRVIVKSQLYINITDSNIAVTIGDNCTFENSYITVADDYNSVTIGKDCMFAMGSGILASDFHAILDLETGERINYASGVSLGDHVWVGMDAKILKNCTIGSHSVIGSNSQVVKSIPDHVVAAGNPARIIKRGTDWSRERIDTKSIAVSNDAFLDAEFSEDIRFYIESCIERRITGWAFLENVDSCDTEIYVVKFFEDGTVKQYKAKTYARGDVAEFFHNERYLFSGFECNFDAIEGCVNEIRIVLRNADQKKYQACSN